MDKKKRPVALSATFTWVGIALLIAGIVLLLIGWGQESGSYAQGVLVSFGTSLTAAAIPYFLILQVERGRSVHVGPNPPDDPDVQLWLDTSED